MLSDIKKEYLDRMREDLKDDYDRYVKSLDEKDTHGIIINKKKLSHSSIDLDYIIKRYKGKILLENDNMVYMLYDKDELSKGGMQIGKEPLHHVGLYYAQEPSAAKVVYEASIKDDDIVLDLCASPGGKSIMTLCSLDKSAGAYLVSNEIDFARAKILKSNIERMGFDNVIVTCNESKVLREKFHEYFDKVIVDAPCSGEGMMRKSIDARLQWSKSLVSSMAVIQKGLIEDAYYMLKAGGSIIYSTCTFSMEEDEGVLDFILEKHSDLKVIKSEKIYPFDYPGEGQFYAIIEKNGTDGERHTMPDIKKLDKLNVIKYSVEKYEKKHEVMMPTHASTHVDDIVFDNIYDLSDDDVKEYLHGDVIRSEKLKTDGFYKVTYKNLGLGLAKAVGSVLKNHYPKGLRNM